jgi:hypothetical protein
MKRDTDTFRMNPVSLFALVGAIAAFFIVGAIVDVLWVAVGAFVGAALGMAVRRFAGDARTYRDAVDLRDSATREDLYNEAKELAIEGRSTMTRDELAAAVAKHHS